MKVTKRLRGFTLVELLVVIAIIGILIGMLLPAVQMVREAARRSACSNNIRQMGLALMNYESAHRHLPPGWTTNDTLSGEPGWGWSAYILPQIEAQNLYDQIDFRVAIEDASHADIINRALPIFQCPSDPAESFVNLDVHIEHDHSSLLLAHDPDEDHDHHELWVGRSNYSGVFGNIEIEGNEAVGPGAFYMNSKTRLAEFTDGLSNTIIVGERRNDLGTISWIGYVPDVDEPAARIVGSADHAPNDPDGHFEDFRSYHPGGINVVLGDGSTHFVTNNIDEIVFQGLSTRRGGEVVSISDR